MWFNSKKATERRLKNREQVAVQFDTILTIDDETGDSSVRSPPSQTQNNNNNDAPISPSTLTVRVNPFEAGVAVAPSIDTTHNKDDNNSVPRRGLMLGGMRSPNGSARGQRPDSVQIGTSSMTPNLSANSGADSNAPATPLSPTTGTARAHLPQRALPQAPGMHSPQQQQQRALPQTPPLQNRTNHALPSAPQSAPSATPNAAPFATSSAPNVAHQGGDVSTMTNGDELYKSREDKVMVLKENLRRLAAALKRYNAQAIRGGKAVVAMTDTIDKLKENILVFHVDSVMAEALATFANINRELAEATVRHHQGANEDLLINLTKFIEEDINHDLKNVKAKYDKARREYDSACSKLAAQRSKAKLDIFKLVIAEREVIKTKAKYEEALDEALYEIDDIELKKETELMDWLVVHYTQAMGCYGDGYRMLVHIEDYLADVEKWTKEWRALFAENSAARKDEQSRRIAEEDASYHKPLLEVLQQHQNLWPIMEKQASVELTRIPSSIDEANWPQFYEFLRANFDPISQALVAAGQKTTLTELTSALGLLDKAKEPVELAT